MDRRRLGLLAVALVAILAMAVAAATLDAAVVGGEGGSGSGPDEKGGIDDDPGASVIDGPSGDAPAFSGGFVPLCVQWLRGPTAQLVIGLCVVGVVGAAWRRFDALFASLTAIALAAGGLIFYTALTGCVEDSTNRDSFFGDWVGNHSLLGGGQAGGIGEAAAQPTPSFAFLAVLVAVVLLAGLTLFRSSGNETTEVTEPGDGHSPPNLARIATQAGAIASRLSGDVDVENEVYRAWFDMTRLVGLDEDPAVTPGEFASAAVAAGLDDRDVAELTRLFEEVRYGGEPPTDERVGSAVAALRRIEAAHVETEGTGGATEAEAEARPPANANADADADTNRDSPMS